MAEPCIARSDFGRLRDGRRVDEYALDNGRGVRLSVINLGGIVTALHLPDRQGKSANVVLGFAKLDDYVERSPNFGAIVGRYANRIANARFELDGQTWQLPPNDGPNTLHGGPLGFAKQWWDVEAQAPASDGSLALDLRYASPDGDQGFPGRLDVHVRYTLTPADEWRIDYRATTDRPTVVNLSHHGYYNLAGAGGALTQRLTIAASRYTPVDKRLIPTGIADVAATPFDFRAPVAIGERIRSGFEQLVLAKGYDHNLILDRGDEAGLAFAARLEDEASGRVMDVETTQPALQLYSGNFLDGSLVGRSGAAYRQGDGICLETQHYPDSPNHPSFPSTVLRPGEVYSSTTVHRFRIGGPA